MFCGNCGKQIADHQKFCRYCGAATEDEITPDKAPQIYNNNMSYPERNSIVNNVFNKEVLNNYLFNVLTVELSKKKLTERKEKTINRIKNYGYYSTINEPYKYTSERLYAFGAMIGIPIVAWILASIGKGILGWILNGINWNMIAIIITVASIIISLIYIIWSFVQDVNANTEYKEKLEKDQKRVEDELEKKQYYQTILPKIEKELSDTKNLLDSIYSVNLTPSKYRNVEAAYFLYDYVSSSTATLSDALLHCDLDTIIEKLDIIIEQQQDMILELARSNALNEKIVEQNDQMLKYAIQTENNTALAAQYSKIAADNARVVASVKMSEWLNN